MLRALFIDFNSFFCSVEQELDSTLRGRPVAVVPVMSDSTCCIAASYEAKRFGIKTGTNVGEARRKCPGLKLVEARHELYVEYHERLIEVVESCAPVAEVASIDELWCELTGRWQAREQAITLAQQIKQAIAMRVGKALTCSIGIAPNPFLAKTACDMRKPDGLVVIEAQDLPQALYGLQPRDLCGIGQQMEKRLHRAGIQSVPELWATSREGLRKLWGGVEGERFFDALHGLSGRRAVTLRGSVGHSHVLPPELRNDAGARGVAHRMLQKAAMRLRKLEHVASALHLSLRYVEGGAWGEEARFVPSQDTRTLTRVLNALWERRPRHTLRPMFVGVTLARLIEAQAATADLFVDAKRAAALNRVLDRLNTRFGKHAVYLGGAFGATDEAPMRIAFTRIPDLETEA